VGEAGKRPLPFFVRGINGVHCKGIISVMTCFKKQDLDNSSLTQLRLVADDSHIPSFFQLLQDGFMVKGLTGCSINSFLTQQLGISPEYITERIHSIFLEGKPVDNLDSAIVHDGSHLSLSAAMPGLVGATMRRGGSYGTLRSSITYNESDPHCEIAEGCVHLKLFNLLMKELGPDLLRRGLYLRSSHLAGFLSGQPLEFWQVCKEIFLNGKPVRRDQLEKEDWLSGYNLVYLSVVTDD